MGWATASRAWWHPDPDAGILSVAVDPLRRREGIGTALAEAAEGHLAKLAVRTTFGRSLGERAAHARRASRLRAGRRDDRVGS